MKTTIQINVSTLERLKNLKRYERDSYDEVLNFLISENEEDTLDEGEITELQEALEQVKEGKIKPIEQIAEELGIALQ
jgi:predicted CopG family antitoxin